MRKDPIEVERAEAWVGDAVLSLFTRQWILQHRGRMDGELLGEFTANRFLLRLGNPTSVEARIGRVYEKDGLVAAFAWIEQELVPYWKLRLSQKTPTRRPLG